MRNAMSSKAPQVRGVYSGKVSRLIGSGCYVEIEGPWGVSEGILYTLEGIVREGEAIWVKVVSTNGRRAVLSMTGIDQRTGRESCGGSTGVFSSVRMVGTSSSHRKGKSNSQLKQVNASRKELDDESEEENREEVEVELRTEMPTFMKPSEFAISRNPCPADLVMENPSPQPGVIKRLKFHRNPVIQKQREGLPVYPLRQKLVEAIAENRVLIVIGETGSGKSTQITQFLAEEGYTGNGMIGCTQPRRIAAISIAKRVSEELGCRLGEEVGYSIRFEDCTCSKTAIKYMTDGMLLREILLDRDLSSYSVIMLDEVHERTTDTDILLGLLKELIRRRPEFRLIVTSATLDAEKFSDFFFGCTSFYIPGRTFPVEIIHSKEPEADYLEAAVQTVLGLHVREPEGDILLFLTGQEEIETVCQVLQEKARRFGRSLPELIVLPAYSALPAESLSRIFDRTPRGKRKVVVATNIAEASLTIDGIYYVVDCGFVKEHRYDAKLGLDSLVVCPISQASAKQRAGRAGRTGPGFCYRLYTESTFKNDMDPCSEPEIRRTNLSSTVLRLRSILPEEIDIFEFEFLDRPSTSLLVSAMEQLYALGAVDARGRITGLGVKMVEFPLEPGLSKMLLTSVKLGCSDEILTIISMLQAQNIFYCPPEKRAEAESRKSKFFQPQGDLLTLLAIYERWKVNDFSTCWCQRNFLRCEALQRAHDIRKELLEMMERRNLPVLSAGRDSWKICKGICAGFFWHAARRDTEGCYRTLVGNRRVFVHPGSSLMRQTRPQWVVYQELMLTSKEYMQGVSGIQGDWLLELAPNIFRTASIGCRKRKLNRLEGLSSAKHLNKRGFNIVDENIY